MTKLSCVIRNRPSGKQKPNDGQMDIVISDLGGPPTLLRNHGAPGRHWISFELAGTKSNRMAMYFAVARRIVPL